MRDIQPSRRQFLATGAAAAAATTVDAQGRQPVVATEPPQPPARRSSEPIRVLTATAFAAQEIERFKSAAPNVEMIVVTTPEEFRRRLPEAEVVFGNLTGADLPVGRQRSLGADGRGRRRVARSRVHDQPDCADQHGPRLRAGDHRNRDGVPALPHARHQTYYMPQFARREMKPVGTAKSADHVELAGKTMGIVGMGGIGSTLARRAHYGFDMRIVGTDAKPMPKPDPVAELHDPSWFMTMVPQVDVLVAAAPHTPATERMFNEKVFRSMKKTAYFLALSRGMLFDDMALVKALKEGWIAGAGLDVFPVGATALDASDLRLQERGDDTPHVRVESRPADAI